MSDLILLLAKNDTPLPTWSLFTIVALIMAGGVFTIWGAVANWDWFFNDQKAEMLVSMFGRGGARIVFGLLGVFILVAGVLLLLLLIYAVFQDESDAQAALRLWRFLL